MPARWRYSPLALLYPASFALRAIWFRLFPIAASLRIWPFISGVNRGQTTLPDMDCRIYSLRLIPAVPAFVLSERYSLVSSFTLTVYLRFSPNFLAGRPPLFIVFILLVFLNHFHSRPAGLLLPFWGASGFWYYQNINLLLPKNTMFPIFCSIKSPILFFAFGLAS